MKIEKEQVDYVANLARLSFTDEEKEEMAKDMGNIINFIDQIKEIDTNDVIPTINVFPINNVFREDKIIPSMNRDELLSNAPNKADGCFSVPIIVE